MKLFHQTLLPCFFLAVIVAVAHSYGVRAPFVFDDFPGLINNELITGDLDFAGLWHHDSSRIVTRLFFILSLKTFGFSPFWLHIESIVWHLGTCVVLFLTLKKLLALTDRSISDKVCTLIAFFTVAIFASHPIQTQAVVYIWQRQTIVVAMFSISAIYTYLSALERQTMGKSGRTLAVASVLLTLLALFSKQNAATLPFILALYGFAFYKQKNSFYWLALTPILPLVVLLGSDLAKTHIEGLTDGMLSPFTYFLTQVNVICTYMRMIVLPFGQSIDHDYPTTVNLLDLSLITSFTVHTTLFYLAAKFWKKNILVCCGIITFYLALAVESSIIPLEDIMFEHRVYLPFAGVVIALAGLLAKSNNLKAALESISFVKGTALAALATMPLCYLSLERLEVWQSEVLLWSDATEKAPTKVRPRLNLAIALAKQGKHHDALMHLKLILQLDPDRKSRFAGTYLSMVGQAYGELGETEQAEKWLLETTEQFPEETNAWLNLGIVSAKKGDLDTAEAHVSKALTLDYRNENAYIYLIRVLIDLNKSSDAANIANLALLASIPSSKLYLDIANELRPFDKELALRLELKAQSIR